MKIFKFVTEIPLGSSVKYEFDKIKPKFFSFKFPFFKFFKSGITEYRASSITRLPFIANYGYLEGYKGADKEPLDCFLVCYEQNSKKFNKISLIPNSKIENIKILGMYTITDEKGNFEEKFVAIWPHLPKDKKIHEELSRFLHTELPYFILNYKNISESEKEKRSVSEFYKHKIALEHLESKAFKYKFKKIFKLDKKKSQL